MRLLLRETKTKEVQPKLKNRKYKKRARIVSLSVLQMTERNFTVGTVAVLYD